MFDDDEFDEYYEGDDPPPREEMKFRCGSEKGLRDMTRIFVWAQLKEMTHSLLVDYYAEIDGDPASCDFYYDTTTGKFSRLPLEDFRAFQSGLEYCLQQNYFSGGMGWYQDQTHPDVIEVVVPVPSAHEKLEALKQYKRLFPKNLPEE